MNKATTEASPDQPVNPSGRLLLEDRLDPIERSARKHVRGFIGTLIEEELAEALGRSR